MEDQAYVLLWVVVLAMVGGVISSSLITLFIPVFLEKKITGRDLGRKGRPVIPESLGLVSGFCFILVLCLAIVPIGYFHGHDEQAFTRQLCMYLAALASFVLTLLLGFADDMVDLKWRYKLFLPAAATLPVIFTYFATGGPTTVVVPNLLRPYCGRLADFGRVFYGVYISTFIIFCSNSINIYSGVNGLETGQSVVLLCLNILHNLIELNGPQASNHAFSLLFLIPFLFTTLPLFRRNWYPADVFVGDTFCYSAGVTLATISVLCHYSKTAALMFVPQLANFVFSLPQLARIVPCPRHRLPRYDPETELRHASTVLVYPKKGGTLQRIILTVFKTLRLVRVTPTKEDGAVEVTNLTLLCLVLNWLGPMTERRLTLVLLFLQVLCGAAAFFVRYGVAKLFFY